MPLTDALGSGDSRLGEVLAEILQAEERGEKPDLERYAASFPELEGPLRAYFHDREAFHRLSPGPRPTESAEAAPAAVDAKAPQPEDERPGGESPPLRAGGRFGGYVIEEELGRGGMGVVYKARQLTPERLVALKVIRTDRLASLSAQERRQWVDRFRREAGLVAALGEFPGIVTLYEVGEHQGQPFFTMRLVTGGSLAQRLGPADAAGAADRRLREQSTNVRLLVHAARAVDYAHRRSVLHRDMKPANILLDEQGAALVSDFGLARRVDETGSLVTAGIEGTVPYIAPEERLERPGAATTAVDVYGLGAILYELLTGRPPFRGRNDFDTLLQVVNEAAVPPRKSDPRLSRDLEAVCLRCLEKEPGRRYRSAAALAEDLENWLAGRPVSARPVGPFGRLSAWARRQPYLAGALAVTAGTLLTATVVSGVFWYRASVAFGNLKQADDAKGRALDDLRKEQRTNHRTTAGLLLDAGIKSADEGEPALGLLRMARALEVAPEDDADLQDVIRANLTAWAQTVSPLHDAMHLPGVVSAAGFTPDGRSIWALSTGSIRSEPRDVGGEKGQFWVFRPEAPDDDYFDGLGNSPIPSHASALHRPPATPRGRPMVWDAVTGQAKTLSFPDDLRALAWSGDGATVLAAAAPSERSYQTSALQFWDVAAGRRVSDPVELRDRVKYAAFSGDGKTAVTIGDQYVEFWDAATGRLAGARMGAYAMRHAACSPDGRFLAVVTGADSGIHQNLIPTITVPGQRGMGHLDLYDLENRKWVGGYGEFGEGVDSDAAVALGPGGNPVLVATSPDILRAGKAMLWDRASGQQRELLGFEGRLAFAAFSPDGKTLLTAAQRGLFGDLGEVVELWDVESRKPRSPPLLAPGTVRAAAFSPDGQTLATGGDGGFLRQSTRYEYGPKSMAAAMAGNSGEAQLWDASNGRPLGRAFRLAQPVLALAYSPDGKLLLTGARDGTARVWDAEPTRPLRPARTQSGVAATADGGRFALVLEVVQGKKTLRLYDAEEDRPCGESLPYSAEGRPAALSPDGRALLAVGEGDAAQLWDARTGKPIGGPLRHNGQHVAAVGFSCDGRQAYTHTDGPARERLDNVHRWRTDTGESLPELGPGQTFAPVAASPDGKSVLNRLATTSLVVVVDRASGKGVGKPFIHLGSPAAALFSPDGRKVLTVGGRSGSWESGQLWDANTGEPIGRPLEHQGSIRAAAFSPDGRRIVTAADDHKARVWDAETGELLCRELAHAGPVLAVGFSPDGKWVVTGCEDGTVRRWHVATGKPVGPPLPHPGAVSTVFVGRDGGTVVTHCADGVARVWETPAPQPESAERVQLWAQVATGMSLEDDAPRSLSLADWEMLRDQYRGAAAP